MSAPLVWEMPELPPWYVHSVRDAGGTEWIRIGDNWTSGWGDEVTWPWLLFNRAPLTAERTAS